MKKGLIFVLFAAFLLCFVSCNKPSEPVEVKTVEPVPGVDKVKLSDVESASEKYYYTMGNYYAGLFEYNYEDFDINAFLQGMIDTDNGTYSISDSEVENIVNEYFSQKNLTAAENFLAENAKKEGVVTTSSGLQYLPVVEADGEKPSENDTVNVDYSLTLLDGTQLDNAKDIEFSLNGVIPGFAEALTLMSPGATYTVYVHPDLGYGKNGTRSIEPDSLLIFNITLNSIVR